MKFSKCCIIFNQPGPGAMADELDVLDQVNFVEENLHLLGIDTYRKGITGNFMSEISDLVSEKPEVVFNLVESISNKGELCYFIPALLNMYSIPYTGNPVEAIFTTTSKALTGRILEKAGIGNPGSFTPSEWRKLAPGRRYIIKPVWEDGSMDITHESVFEYYPGYENRFADKKDSHWIIQEYIEGREFNVTVLASENGPEVLPPAEMTFRNYEEGKPKIVDFRAKWETGSFEYENTVRYFPGKDLDPELDRRIRDTAIRCWHEFGMKGYARVDMRVDKDNNPYVIEVNANPCISPDSGVVAAVAEAGICFKEVVRRIMNDINI